MRPAFSSPQQAAAFGLLLLFLLAAPWLGAKGILPRPNYSYGSQSIRWENVPWFQKFIFEETNDIDIAFLGSSHILNAIDTPYVQKKLDERLGRKTVVRTLGWGSAGFDSLYFFARELLSRRRVKMIVFYDECGIPIVHDAHQYLPQWYRWGDDDGVLDGLPFKYRAIFYHAAVIGMPRNLLAVLSPNLPIEPGNELIGGVTLRKSANPEDLLGCMSTHLGFDPSYNPDGNMTYVAYDPPNALKPDDVLLLTSATASNFAFSDRSLPESQIYFARQFALLAKANGCALVALHMPLFGERTSQVITETRNWADLMQTDVGLMGIPAGRLFAGLDEAQTKLLFSDPDHLNVNGQKYFTPLITPGLLNYYETHTHH